MQKAPLGSAQICRAVGTQIAASYYTNVAQLTNLAKSPVSRERRSPRYHFGMDIDEPIQIPLLIRRMMRDASEAQLLEATAIFEDYLAIAWRILKRLERDKSMDSSSGGL
jgi:hypothetical protein